MTISEQKSEFSILPDTTCKGFIQIIVCFKFLTHTYDNHLDEC